ncbi:MAG: hypothetical protein ABSH28_03935 [Acidobacteriota bacterium]
MTLAASLRIINDLLFKRGIRDSYWATRSLMQHLVTCFRPSRRHFAKEVVRGQAIYLFGSLRPIAREVQERARAAAAWLARAQDINGDGGFSQGYFPCDAEGGWRRSYPETTGYIIPTLLDYATRFEDPDARDRALRAAHWEISIQMPSGAVQGGLVLPKELQSPVAFNTGMVLHGWSAAYRATGDSVFLGAARKAADFLLQDLDSEGYFRTHGPFVATHALKTYDCLCAWPVYRFGEDVEERRYQLAALKAVDAAIRQQRSNGWFANNCLDRPEAPLTHTIGYALQGILEVGILSRNDKFIESVRRGVNPLLSGLSSNGFLHGRSYSDWIPAAFSSCLTGSAQTAVVCYRLYEHSGDARYWRAAQQILNFLKPLQSLNSKDCSINGALAGSFPILGSYMRAGYPNWATKYYLDGLLMQDRLGHALAAIGESND